ncbi:hypothetical protein [Salinivibrio sp. ES.052]|uniref:hypothetical protein n=1 Tax=Salinivibrio sp. ES.052 TaxID=1882823 RepID=UPI00092AFF95|nr:hypothetical protein [Salinivibrio sp. ES.052]SIO06797.1 hypothetical protein SAMN05444724_1908 [Salinivibrio sp. ES.052]SIO40796.1 hypothetical protein SAMN05444724_3237 [Salinivibrio sp. ES.052]
MENIDQRIEKLTDFLGLLDAWEEEHPEEIRSRISRARPSVQREVLEAGCLHTITVSPPPAVGGMVMQNVNPFDMIFERVYLRSLNPYVRDMINQTIGVLEEWKTHPPEEKTARNEPEVKFQIQQGYVFVAMPIGPENPFDDVLDAVKEACQRCGLNAERVDEAQANERITDRILESIQKAEYVIVDLTESRPNVFYEAGYAQGIGKLPIYIARSGTKLEFDLKDYPIIFFESYRELKSGLERRLRGLAENNA